MVRLRVSLLLTVVCSMVAAATAHAQATDPVAPAVPITKGVDLVGTNAYLWRGFVATDRFSVQPNLWLKYGVVTVSSWSNAARPQGHGLLTEHDLTVDVTKAAGRFAVSAGWINYLFPTVDTGRYSNEFYAGVSHASFLNPSVRVYHDVQAGAGTYLNGAVSHEFTVGRLLVTPSAAVGYNRHQWIAESTWSDALMGLKVKLPSPSKRLTIAPFLNYSRSLARDLFPSRFSGGLGVSVQ
ncbi:MAG: hypothetical protein WCQ64_10715 [Acidobacteriota bacterium]